MEDMERKKRIRYIGIDFGTSMTVMASQDYEQDENGNLMPLGDIKHFCENGLITSGNKIGFPTCIAKVSHNDTEEIKLVFAGAAEEWINNENCVDLAINFKMDLISTNEEDKQKAENLMNEFFRYLRKIYNNAKENGLLNKVDEEYTWVSYPSKWLTERDKTKNIALKHFRNVKGIKEPEAAFRYFLEKQHQNIQEGSHNILVIDMGAGTADFYLAKVNLKTGEIKELAVHPEQNKDNLDFGGKNIDEALCNYCIEYFIELAKEKIPPNWEKKCIDKINNNRGQIQSFIKKEKEQTYSNIINKENIFDLQIPRQITSALDTFIDDIPQKLKIDRETFIQLINKDNQLKTFTTFLEEIISKAAKEHSKTKEFNGPEDVDYVILTGGNSQWYFVQDILKGTFYAPGFEDFSFKLPKIAKDPSRIFIDTKVSPQQTVARGLVTAKNKKYNFLKRNNTNYWIEIITKASNVESSTGIKQLVTRSTKLPISNCKNFKDSIHIDADVDFIYCNIKMYAGPTLKESIAFKEISHRFEYSSFLGVTHGVKKVAKCTTGLAVWAVGKVVDFMTGDTSLAKDAENFLDESIDEKRRTDLSFTLDFKIDEEQAFEGDLCVYCEQAGNNVESFVIEYK